MRLTLLAVLALPVALAACSLPDLVAHGVKSYENRDSQPPPQTGGAPAAAPSTARNQPAVEPPAPLPASGTTGGVPPRESVSVEPLK